MLGVIVTNPPTTLKKWEMNKLTCLAAILFCLTISCSNPNQPDNSDNAINQMVIANDVAFFITLFISAVLAGVLAVN